MNIGRKGRFTFFQKLLVSAEIEVIPAGLGLLHVSLGPLRQGYKGRPRRHHQAFLRGAYHHIQPPGIHFAGGSAQGAHSVHHKQGLVISSGPGDCLDIVEHSRGGLVMDRKDQLNFGMLGQKLGHLIWVHAPIPGKLQDMHHCLVGCTQLSPALTEKAAH